MSSIALLAGHRWAIALVVIAEMLLLPSLWPRLFVQPPDVVARAAVALACASAIPGILALRRAAVALVVITGVRRSRRSCRAMTAALASCFVFAAVLPMM